jgi:hypothetical protein
MRLNPIELASSVVQKQKIQITDIRCINVSDQNFYRRTGGKSLFLIQLTKGKGKHKQSVMVSVLSNEPPTPEKALVLAFRMNRYFHLAALYEFLGSRQYNQLAEAVLTRDGAA